MARQLLITLAVLACLALAGCSSAPTKDPQTSTGPRPAAGGSAAQPSAGSAAAPTAAKMETPVKAMGTTPTGGCAGAGGVTGQCEWEAGKGDYFLPLSAKGNLTGLKGSLTWTAAAPATERLEMLLLAREGNGWSFQQGYPIDYGTSPLAIDWDLSDFADKDVGLWISSYQGEGANPVYVGVGVGQDFSFDGVLTSS